eukprot:scaffold64407_cov24-Tisochrysis_lutea.AAC.3
MWHRRAAGVSPQLAPTSPISSPRVYDRRNARPEPGDRCTLRWRIGSSPSFSLKCDTSDAACA